MINKTYKINMDVFLDKNVLSFTLAAGIGRFILWRRHKIIGNNITCDKPLDTLWLSQNSFNVLTAICDTFIPSIDIDDVTFESIAKAFDSSSFLSSGILDFNNLKEHKDYFANGAIKTSCHIKIAEVLSNFLYSNEKEEFNMILNILGTSAGNCLITGFAVPFYNLPLNDRTNIIQALRDSNLQPLRSFYQV